MRAREDDFHVRHGGVAITGSALTDSEQQLGAGIFGMVVPGLWNETCNPGWR